MEQNSFLTAVINYTFLLQSFLGRVLGPSRLQDVPTEDVLHNKRRDLCCNPPGKAAWRRFRS